ncbi:MAG: hypothetical protein GY856_42350, partial [bacterium]|nr:hypothetical protein [bacterium]
KQASSELEHALSIVDLEPNGGHEALRIRIVLLLLEARLGQRIAEVCGGHANPVRGSLAAAVDLLDTLESELSGFALAQLRGLRNVVDARLLWAREPEGAKKLLDDAMASFADSEAVEPAALAAFQMLRFLAAGLFPDDDEEDLPEPGLITWEGSAKAHYTDAVARQLVRLLDRAY